MPSDKNDKVSDKNGQTSDAILEELFSSIKSEPKSEDSGSNQDSDNEKRERRKIKKSKKSKKKKKKHKRSRTTSSSGERDREMKRTDDSRKTRPMSPPEITHRRVPPPPPPEEWVPKDTGAHYDFRHDKESRHRHRSDSSRHGHSSRRDENVSRCRHGKRHRHDHDSHHRHEDERHSRSHHHRRRSQSSGDDDPRPSKMRNETTADPFWESKWEAIQVQTAAEEKEKKGRHYLQPDRKKVRTPSPESDRDSSPETNELKSLRRLKDIENLVVKENEKYVAEPPNPDLFEWDEKTKMRRKKLIPAITMEPPDSDSDDKKIDSTTMTLDEIEEIQRKREKKKQKKDEKGSKSEAKEEGEVHSEDENRHRRKYQRSPDRFYSRSRDYDRHRRSSPHKSYGYRDYRKDRGQTRSWRSRSRSRDRGNGSRDRGDGFRDRDDGFRGSRSAIDKAKLLAIAQKNAVKLLNSNDLKGMNKDRLVAIKSGGQSLNELTIFCRELARKGITDEFSDEEGAGDSDNEKELNHPFAVRDRALPIPNPIMLGIQGMKNQGPANGLTLSKMTPAMRDAARSHRLVEFPVSSGNAHRVKEVDLKHEESDNVPTGKVAAQTAVTSLVAAGSDDPIMSMLKLEHKPDIGSMLEAQLIKANPLGQIMFGAPVEPMALMPPPELAPSPPPPIPAFEVIPDSSDTKAVVFEPLSQPSMDISSIISVRLNAMKRLSSNPNDPEAMSELYNAQQEMGKWADSKNKPGQFTGTTGAKILSKGELLTGTQAWAKIEQFTGAQKVSGGFGEYMLRKMGWREGEGLGKERSGTVDPLQLELKMDRRGLMTAEEGGAKRVGGVLTLTGLKDLSGKHPVTAILEVSTRRKWGPPNFTQIFECGPSHKKQYIWKCTVNGVDYQPTIASDNKKKAKANAATLALQELGMLPKDPNNPL